MSLNDLQLTVPVIRELYTNTLTGDTASRPMVQEELVSGQASQVETGNQFKYLGNNRKEIVVVVNTPEAVFLPDSELNFLTGILAACQLSLDDVAVVNIYSYPASAYKDLAEQFKTRIMLLFDTPPSRLQLPVSFPHYQLQGFAGNTFLSAPSLRELENDKVEKSKLWVCLKRLFNI